MNFMFVWVPALQAPQGLCSVAQWHTLSVSQLYEEPQVWEPQFFIMGCKKTFLLLQKEVLFLSSKAICYLNIYEKTVQNKAASSSPHKTCRNSRNAWHLPFIPYIKKCPQVTQIVSGFTPFWPWESFSMLPWFKYYRDNAFLDPLI